jgi:hypothetical protein
MMFRRYGEIALDVSHIEVQQLMHFLRSVGEDMRLNYTKGHYGPYADNLRKAMRVMEGHFILGFGDGSKPIREAEPMELLASVHWVATRKEPRCRYRSGGCRRAHRHMECPEATNDGVRSCREGLVSSSRRALADKPQRTGSPVAPVISVRAERPATLPLASTVGRGQWRGRTPTSLQVSVQQGSQVRQSHSVSVGGAGRPWVWPQRVCTGAPVGATRSHSRMACRCPATGNHQNRRNGGRISPTVRRPRSSRHLR